MGIGKKSKAKLEDVWDPTLREVLEAIRDAPNERYEGEGGPGREIADYDQQLRRKAYSVLLDTTFCLASASPTRLAFEAIENEQGDLVLPAFSDPEALKLWEPNPTSIVAVHARRLFQLALESGFSEIRLNAWGPGVTRLSKSEIEHLAEGVPPE